MRVKNQLQIVVALANERPTLKCLCYLQKTKIYAKVQLYRATMYIHTNLLYNKYTSEGYKNLSYHKQN